jgi:hypothetical protein
MNRENIYWGPHRFGTAMNRALYNMATRFSRRDYFKGHLENTAYFWGDFCKTHITYVRNLVFKEINLNRVNPTMPYNDPDKPFVNFWFSSCEGGDVRSFNKMICEANQDRLESEGGICIMYTHFASGFVSDGRLDRTFQQLMRRLVSKRGWFVSVTTLLDYLRKSRSNPVIPRKELAHMERFWLFSKLRTGPS